MLAMSSLYSSLEGQGGALTPYEFDSKSALLTNAAFEALADTSGVIGSWKVLTTKIGECVSISANVPEYFSFASICHVEQKKMLPVMSLPNLLTAAY